MSRLDCVCAAIFPHPPHPVAAPPSKQPPTTTHPPTHIDQRAAYKGPEEYVDWAKGGAGASGSGGNSSSSATGAGEQWLGDVRDFYRSPAVRQLYKDHLSYMLGRTNQISGLPYASDPAIFAFDVLNEPRCPGCDAGALAEHLSWLGEMSGHLKGLVKGGALVLAGTEGFFTPQASGESLRRDEAQ